jgi:antitoxin (DNA-binding transcriptional repressor) of toxin-antitoxin stability system
MLMSIVKINDIKDKVEELVTRVQAGETILIEKDGETVARTVAMPRSRPNRGQQRLMSRH